MRTIGLLEQSVYQRALGDIASCFENHGLLGIFYEFREIVPRP